MKDPAAVHVLGVDAGATQTRIAMSDPDRKLIGIETTGPFNLRQHNPHQLLTAIRVALDNLLKKCDETGLHVHAIAVGAAGVGTESERELVRTTIQSHFKTTHVFVHHDAFIAHMGAFDGQAGVLVTSGTGSIAYGRNSEGVEARAGGWGWMLGDEGSGWWIAREAVRAALADWEGSGPETQITQLVTDRFNLPEAYALVPLLYTDKIKRSDLTRLTVELAAIARNGDTVATDIFTRAGTELGTLALNAARRLSIPSGELEVAFLGGVGTGANDLLLPGIQRAWENDSDCQQHGMPTIVEPRQDAVNGALLWARESLIRRSYA